MGGLEKARMDGASGSRIESGIRIGCGMRLRNEARSIRTGSLWQIFIGQNIVDSPVPYQANCSFP